jgi:hypothetical protein
MGFVDSLRLWCVLNKRLCFFEFLEKKKKRKKQKAESRKIINQKKWLERTLLWPASDLLF